MTQENNNYNNYNLISYLAVYLILTPLDERGSFRPTLKKRKLRLRRLGYVAQEYIARFETQIQTQDFLPKAPSFSKTALPIDYFALHLLTCLSSSVGCLHSLVGNKLSFLEGLHFCV